MKFKAIKYCVLISSILLCLSSCKEEMVGQPPINGEAPAMISDPVVENIPGGAIISYKLPENDYLLGVKAVYTLNGEEKYTNASMYINKIKVEGFGSTDAQTVKLYTIDRSQNESTPVSIEIHPLTPPVTSIFETLSMKESFGGVYFTWDNKSGSDIALYIMTEDSIGEMQTAEIVYTKAKEGAYGLRGFDAKEARFSAYIRDRWDNVSDTLTSTLTPLYEKRLDRTLHKRFPLPGDNLTEHESFYFTNLFNGIEGGEDFWLTNMFAETTLPVTFTIDLGVTTKLSRYKLWHRGNHWTFIHSNPKRWAVYGVSQLTEDPKTNPEYYESSQYQKDWYYLGSYTPKRPSGTPDSSNPTAEDIEYGKKGFEVTVPDDAPPLRYLRIVVYEVYAMTDVHFSELAFWGGEPIESNEKTK